MKIGLFGGSFDPVHSQHVALAESAVRQLGLERLIVIPSAVAPHKRTGAAASGAERIEMCRIAFRGLRAEVSAYEIEHEGTSYSYLTCSYMKEKYPDDELFFLVGADMLENFPHWKKPEKILECVTLAAGGRGEQSVEEYAGIVYKTFGKKVVLLPFSGQEVSSTRIRVELAFGKRPEALDADVYAYVKERGLYTHPAIAPALALEKPERREHSFRMALMAAEHAAAAGVNREKAILAAALHDCGKYVPLDSPLLQGCVLPDCVPPPVVHQYTGAYLAEHLFGIEDEDVLNAIRYHTSGREGMSPLEKLIFVSDMLESARDFDGVSELRQAFESGLDEGFRACLARQLSYLKEQKSSVYPLTECAFAWINSKTSI